MKKSAEQVRFAASLKSIARNQSIKQYIQTNPLLSEVVSRGAKRFVAGETRQDGLKRATDYLQQHHRISLEFIGENTMSKQECITAKEELKQLIVEMGEITEEGTVSFDLSHIGMMIDEDFTYDQLNELAEVAKERQVTLMISMEESEKTDRILSLYERVVKVYANVGITLQVHLHRSEMDLQRLLRLNGRIRLVKGAYQEPEARYLQRSETLNARYIEFVETCVKASHELSIATHDEQLLQALGENGLLQADRVEIEMLDGVQKNLLDAYQQSGCQTRVYITYGTEWYLYVVHRIAEHPENVYTLIADMVERK